MQYTIKKESLELKRLSNHYSSKNKGFSTFIIENNTIYFHSKNITNLKNLPDNKEVEKINGLISFDFFNNKILEKKHLDILINNDLDVLYKNNIDFNGIEITCNNQDISYFTPKNYAIVKINYLRFIDNLNNELKNYNYNGIVCTRNNKFFLEKLLSESNLNIDLDSLKKSIKFLELKKEQHFYIYNLENCFLISPVNFLLNLKDCKYLSIICKERKCKNIKNVL